MVTQSILLEYCATPRVGSGDTHARCHSASPKDHDKLSINFLSSEDHRAGRTTPHNRHHSSALSTHARGVNRPDSSYHPPEVEVETSEEDSSGQSRSYRLDIVQHPDRTAEYGTNTLTRLPLAPPLIAQLVVRDSAGRTVADELDLPFLVAQLSLLSSDGSTPMDYVAGEEGRHTRERLLYGSLVSSPHLLRNLQGRRGVYFLFPDVSVRRRGRFSLKVSLIKLPRFDDPDSFANGSSGGIVAEARSLPFDVYPLRDYIAPAQTPLTQYFLQQGARMYAFAAQIQFARGPPLS